MLSALGGRGIRDARAIHCPQEEARVWQSYAASGNTLPLRIWKTGFRAAEVVDTRGGRSNAIGEGIDPPLATHFETMAAVHEHSAQHGRRLIQDHRIESRNADGFPHAAAGCGKQAGDPSHPRGLAGMNIWRQAAGRSSRAGKPS